MALNFDRSKPVPLLILSDAAECLTGLARIGRDLASLLAQMPQFRVGYLGRGGVGRRAFPWAQYSFPEAGQWGEEYLPRVWQDFAGGDNGIVFSLWDASRMLWFGQPGTLQSRPDLQRFLGDGRSFQKWGYFPVDGVGPDRERLPAGMTVAVMGYDRVLAASEWGAQTLQASGRGDADWIPHGVFTNVFTLPKNQLYGDATEGRELIGWDPNDIIVGVNMTNQARKDWPVVFHTIHLLKAIYGNRLKLWAHTDTMLGYWNLYALATDYGIESFDVTTELTDAQLAARYAACDATFLPTGGEGFGYPIAESMACGTACVTTAYAAGAALVQDDCKAEPMTLRVDTMHNVCRAVNAGWEFANKLKQQIELKRNDWEGRGVQVRGLVEHLDWTKLRFVWEKWLLAGIGL